MKGIWRDLLMYCSMYTAVSLAYRFGISQDENMKLNFEKICVNCGDNGEYIPLSFILGFYVTQVVTRWWGQFTTLAWPDELALNMLAYVPGNGKPKKVRRTVVRWANLAHILTLRRLSTATARRFPTLHHLVDAGLLTEMELKKLDQVIETTDSLYPIHWVPLSWASDEIRKAKEEGFISSDALHKELQTSLTTLEAKNRLLLGYGWMNIPLVYTQLVTIAVYVYFLVSLLGRQFLTPTRYIDENGSFIKVPHGTPGSVNLVGHKDTQFDLYVPFFTIMQFIFYVGWLKVAETMINPFGDDDDDFDVNFIIDKNFQSSYLMVEGGNDEDLEEDPYGDTIPPTTLPHTVASLKRKVSIPTLPTDNMKVKAESLAPVEEPDRKISVKSSKSWFKGEMSGHRELERRKVSVQSLNLPRIVIDDDSEGYQRL